jgi:hypothetical protein
MTGIQASSRETAVALFQRHMLFTGVSVARVHVTRSPRVEAAIALCSRRISSLYLQLVALNATSRTCSLKPFHSEQRSKLARAVSSARGDRTTSHRTRSDIISTCLGKSAT